MRFALHLPTLYLLSQKLLLWVLLVIQTSGIRIGSSAQLMAWAEKKDMSEVCWSTFVAICAAFCVEAFVRALDGQGSHGAAFGMGGENSNTTPFNLVGYAFLLHIYSSPSSHNYYPLAKGMPSRPDKHVVITIAIPLFQLTILHILSISKRLSMHRLLPTALSSFLSLTHFHLTLLSHFASFPLPSFLLPAPDDPASTKPRNPHTGRHQTYPLLNYVPNVFETLLILSILLTHFLNLLARLVLLGSANANHPHRIARTRRQSGSSTNDPVTPFAYFRSVLSSLPYDEDFGVVLLRLSTQSLEAAAGRGWRNEVAGVYAGGLYLGGSSSEHEEEREREKGKEREVVVDGKERMEYGSMRIGRVDVGGMVSASVTSTTTSRLGARSLNRRTPTSVGTKYKAKTKVLRGLNNEIRTVSSSALPLADTTSTRDAESGSVSAQVNFLAGVLHMFGFGFRMRVMGRLAWAGVGVGWRIVRMFGKGGNRLEHEEGEGGDGELGIGRGEGQDEEGVGDEEGSSEGGEEKDEEAYRRFLRGESLSSSDEEDGEYVSGSEADVSWEADEDEEEEDESYAEDGTAGQKEVLALLADILFPSGASDPVTGPSSGSESGSGSVLGSQDQRASLRDVLAHLLHSPTASSNTPDQDEGANVGPMTRRRWGALVGKYGVGDNEQRWVEERRRESESGGKERSSVEARACVVCLAEVREVICWPCRCLAMCNGCREALAARSVPSKHRCPCCRRSVEGFSRIYVP